MDPFGLGAVPASPQRVLIRLGVSWGLGLAGSQAHVPLHLSPLWTHCPGQDVCPRGLQRLYRDSAGRRGPLVLRPVPGLTRRGSICAF